MNLHVYIFLFLSFLGKLLTVQFEGIIWNQIAASQIAMDLHHRNENESVGPF